MKKHFFSTRNIEDYRKIFSAALSLKNSTESMEDFDQRCFLVYIKDSFKISEKIFESRIVGETPVEGLRLDFNFGLRLDVPKGNFRIKISDADTGEIFFDKYIFEGGRLISAEQYFIRWHIEVFRDNNKIFSHTLNLEGQPVELSFAKMGLGDLIALLPFAREFKLRHNCKLSICLPDHLREFAANLFPDLPQIDEIDFHCYATYHLIIFKGKTLIVPFEIYNTSLERIGGLILGINFLPAKPVFKPTLPPVTNAPYVCIGVQASTPRKSWLYPGGWKIIVDYLKSLGYRVFCIDKKNFQSAGKYSVSMPDNAEDFTGDFPIVERANMLYHAEFFIGLSSGLSWLADAVNCPVVMICGFSQDWFEFYTPYRVANRLVCNGCFNDVRVNFLNDTCPYHKNTARELECQKKISPRQVLNAVERLIIDKNLIPPIMRN